MPETFKEQQIESLFEPKTADDRAVIHLLKAMEELGDNHRPASHPFDTSFSAMHGALAGMAVHLATQATCTFDPDFVDRITTNIGADFLSAEQPTLREELGNEE